MAPGSAVAARGRADGRVARRDSRRRDPPPRAAVVEVPLLFESGMEGVFDKTIAVIADEGVRAERAGARGHEGLEGRTSAQLSQAGKVATCGLHVSATTAPCQSWRGSSPNCSIRYEHCDLPRPTSTAPREHAAPAACRRRVADRPGRRPGRCGAGIAGIGPLADEVREITLPLRHEDIIRQQAADKERRRRPDRRRDLRGVEVPRPDLARGRARADADHARRPPTTSPTKSGGTRSSRATSRARRSTSPTAPGTCDYLTDKYEGE